MSEKITKTLHTSLWSAAKIHHFLNKTRSFRASYLGWSNPVHVRDYESNERSERQVEGIKWVTWQDIGFNWSCCHTSEPLKVLHWYTETEWEVRAKRPPGHPQLLRWCHLLPSLRSPQVTAADFNGVVYPRDTQRQFLSVEKTSASSIKPPLTADAEPAADDRQCCGSTNEPSTQGATRHVIGLGARWKGLRGCGRLGNCVTFWKEMLTSKNFVTIKNKSSLFAPPLHDYNLIIYFFFIINNSF